MAESKMPVALIEAGCPRSLCRRQLAFFRSRNLQETDNNLQVRQNSPDPGVSR
jgi:hypothetical protein